MTLATLRKMDCPVENLKPKSWDEFKGLNRVSMDFVFTVCDTLTGSNAPPGPVSLLQRTGLSTILRLLRELNCKGLPPFAGQQTLSPTGSQSSRHFRLSRSTGCPFRRS